LDEEQKSWLAGSRGTPAPTHILRRKVPSTGSTQSNSQLAEGTSPISSRGRIKSAQAVISGRLRSPLPSEPFRYTVDILDAFADASCERHEELPQKARCAEGIRKARQRSLAEGPRHHPLSEGLSGGEDRTSKDLKLDNERSALENSRRRRSSSRSRSCAASRRSRQAQGATSRDS
jgi:hypothetical protein